MMRMPSSTAFALQVLSWQWFGYRSHDDSCDCHMSATCWTHGPAGKEFSLSKLSKCPSTTRDFFTTKVVTKKPISSQHSSSSEF
ncbi:Hypp9151 [Branchiostoma lanceolatum]|uniref:Hypp9151 protein n=1 Tax=Branchiostoma lanceolatum TaxID=7740 RepID=A0A8J9ZC11_BRALA|nr:Hypp9151 [Branchiostoma lanceolatum]